MAYAKEVAGTFLNYDCIENVINYICDPIKTPSGYIGGLSVIPTSREDIIMQFRAVKEIFHKENGKKVRHFVVSFSPYQQLPEENLFEMAMLIAGYYADNYQIIYAIHEDRIYQHIHFAMNTVSFRDGKKHDYNRADYYGFMNHIAIVTNMHSLTTVEMTDAFEID